MQLRDHPLMIYHGIRNWPPAWTWRSGQDNAKPRGEIGILRDLFLSDIEPRTHLYLIVEHEGSEYMGCVMFEDSAFCRQIYQLLKDCCGRRIFDLGSLDVSHLL